MLDALASWPVSVLPSAAGLHLAAYAGLPCDLLSRAAAEGIAVETIAASRRLPGPDGLVIGYGAATTESILEGLARLRRLVTS